MLPWCCLYQSWSFMFYLGVLGVLHFKPSAQLVIFLSVSQPQVEPLVVILNNTTPYLRARVGLDGQEVGLTSKPALSKSFLGVNYMKKSCGAGTIKSKLIVMRIHSPALKLGGRTYYKAKEKGEQGRRHNWYTEIKMQESLGSWWFSGPSTKSSTDKMNSPPWYQWIPFHSSNYSTYILFVYKNQVSIDYSLWSPNKHGQVQKE